jgi:hypothetical protein
MIPYHGVLVVLAACGLRWRSAWLRILLVFLAVAELQREESRCESRGA